MLLLLGLVLAVVFRNVSVLILAPLTFALGRSAAIVWMAVSDRHPPAAT